MTTTGKRNDRVVQLLLERYGTTFAEEAGIPVKDQPSPLYRLLVLCVLLAAPVSWTLGVAAARALAAGGLRTAKAMLDSEWQQRVELLSGAGYRRFDERTATVLGDGAELVVERWSGDLRRLRDEAEDAAGIQKLLRQVPGIGPVAAVIFCREAQAVWPVLVPFADDRVLDGAGRAGLPSSPAALAGLVPSQDFPRLAAVCVRATLDADVLVFLEEELGAPGSRERVVLAPKP
ncbi:MAG: endonuclease [Actinomycetes bacterium]